MSEMLAHYITVCARVTAYTDHVRIRSTTGKEQLSLHGQTLYNFFGNQEWLLYLVEIPEVTSLVGSTVSTEDEGSEGRVHASLVVERIDAELYCLGYAESEDIAAGVMVDAKTLQVILEACRATLIMGDNVSLKTDEDFWVLHARLGNDNISISTEMFEILPATGPRFTISNDNLDDWLQIFSVAECLGDLEVGSMQHISQQASMYRIANGLLYLKIITGDRLVGLSTEPSLLALCQRLMGAVWLGDESLNDLASLIADIVDEQIDQDEDDMS